MKPLGIVIIGCGRIAEHHCRAIASNSNLKLIAVCDIIKDKSEKLSLMFSVKHYTNYHTMLKTENDFIDIVAIITPSGIHFEHSLEIIEIYNKHVII